MLAVRQGDCGIAQTVGLRQRQPEQRSQKPRGGADDQRQQRERQQAAGLRPRICLIRSASSFIEGLDRHNGWTPRNAGTSADT